MKKFWFMVSVVIVGFVVFCACTNFKFSAEKAAVEVTRSE